ncbi:MAG: DUF6390 family protein [Egibacteraceae bacterium]
MDPGPRTVTSPETPPAARAGGYGPLLFARYAYPPNAQGYCGPAEHATLLEYGTRGFVDAGLIQLEQSFRGAWPYLSLIAEATGMGDPLDHRVVEAYWIGNHLLDRIDGQVFGQSLERRFRHSAGPAWSRLAEAVPAGGRPHHSFHVFCVYPWVGLLRRERDGGQPLRVLDRCRIRPGMVVSTRGDEVTVRSRPLRWDGNQLTFGPVETEVVTGAVAGRGFVTDLRPGELVALHWDWVCDRLSRRQLHNLLSYTAQTLRMTNERLRHPGPAAVLS